MRFGMTPKRLTEHFHSFLEIWHPEVQRGTYPEDAHITEFNLEFLGAPFDQAIIDDWTAYWASTGKNVEDATVADLNDWAERPDKGARQHPHTVRERNWRTPTRCLTFILAVRPYSACARTQHSHRGLPCPHRR